MKLMMEDVTINVSLSTNRSELFSFFVKSVLGPHDIWKQRQNLITSWCRITKKITGNVTFSTNQSKAVLKCWHFWPMRIRFCPRGGSVFFWGPRVIFSLLINQTWSTYMWFNVFHTLGLADFPIFHHASKAPGPFDLLALFRKLHIWEHI